MAAEYPEWVLKHKKPGTAIYPIRGKYYLYESTSQWDPEKKRAKHKTGKYLGRITEEGFIPPKAKKNDGEPVNIQVKEYGLSTFIEKEMANDIEKLTEIFPEEYKTIIVMALARLLHQAPLKNMQFVYEHSFLSEIYPNLTMNDKALGTLLRDIGRDRARNVSYLKNFIKAEETLLVDVTNLISQSDNLDMAQVGYNSQRIYDPQINLLCIFSATSHRPIYYRMVPGNIREISAFRLSMIESGIKDVIAIGDKGFYSKANVDAMNSENMHFILPLRRNLSLIDYSPVEVSQKMGFEGTFRYENRHIWHHKHEVDGMTLHLFLDDRLRSEEEKDYLDRVDDNVDDKYTLEGYREHYNRFGTLAILTNRNDLTSKQIYEHYKSRNEIEVMFDEMKTVLKMDTTYMQNPDALEGWMFVNFIALTWFYALYRRLLEKEMLKKNSPMDIIKRLNEVKKVKIDGKWHYAETTSNIKALMSKLGIDIT